MCGQELPDAMAPLTKRELDVLTRWWMTGSVKKAAAAEGITEQRAKNMLARARLRSRVATNPQLLAAHMDEVRKLVSSRMQHNSDGAEAV